MKCLRVNSEFLCFNWNFCFAPLWRMGPRCSSAETHVCHRSYIIAARSAPAHREDCVCKLHSFTVNYICRYNWVKEIKQQKYETTHNTNFWNHLQVTRSTPLTNLERKSSADRITCFLPLSCNNVAPVTNLCLGRATTRSHSSQWSKKKLQLKHKNSLFTLQTFHYNYYWWSQSLLNRFGWEIL